MAGPYFNLFLEQQKLSLRWMRPQSFCMINTFVSFECEFLFFINFHIILGVLFLYFDFLMDFSIPNMFVSFDPYPLDKEFLTSRSPDILYCLVLLARAISFSDHWFICVALARSIHTSRIRSATSFIQLTQQNPLQSDACSAPGKIP